MSVYRQPNRFTRRTVVIAAVAALVGGLAVGYVVGHASAPNPSLQDNLSSLRSDLKPAEEGLELVRTEYGQAVKGGRVAQPTEYQAAKSDVQRAEDAVNGTRSDLQTLNPRGAATFERAVKDLSAAVDSKQPAARIGALSRQASAALRAVVPSGGS